MRKKVWNVVGNTLMCTAPFALFCSGNGTGLIQAPIFLVLGFICKMIADGSFDRKNYVAPKDWWEYQYKNAIQKKMNERDARKFADSVVNSNRFPMPSEEEKEKIAEDMGIVSTRRLLYRCCVVQLIAEEWKVNNKKYFKTNQILDKILVGVIYSEMKNVFSGEFENRIPIYIETEIKDLGGYLKLLYSAPQSLQEELREWYIIEKEIFNNRMKKFVY